MHTASPAFMMLRTPADALRRASSCAVGQHISFIATDSLRSVSPCCCAAHAFKMQCTPFAGPAAHRGEDTCYNGLLRPPVKGDSCNMCSSQLLASSGIWDPQTSIRTCLRKQWSVLRPWTGRSECRGAGENARHLHHIWAVVRSTRVHAQLGDKEWIDAVVTGEDIVQREDMHMCDLVQGGLASPAYDVGRCAALPPALPLHQSCMVQACAGRVRERAPSLLYACVQVCAICGGACVPLPQACAQGPGRPVRRHIRRSQYSFTIPDFKTL